MIQNVTYIQSIQSLGYNSLLPWKFPTYYIMNTPEGRGVVDLSWITDVFVLLLDHWRKQPK